MEILGFCRPSRGNRLRLKPPPPLSLSWQSCDVNTVKMLSWIACSQNLPGTPSERQRSITTCALSTVTHWNCPLWARLFSKAVCSDRVRYFCREDMASAVIQEALLDHISLHSWVRQQYCSPRVLKVTFRVWFWWDFVILLTWSEYCDTG